MELLRKTIVQTVYTILFLLIVWTNGLCQNADDVSKIVITKEPRFGYMTWKIQAANGIWHYEIEKLENGEPGTGFSSAIDQSGNDWIGNDCVGRREWRGWPNFGSDGFGHPCRGGSGKSRWLDSDGNQIEFDKEYVGEYLILESWNEKFRLWYHFFPSHVAIQVFEAQDLYSFLWEGPIAGEMNLEQQYYVLEDGKKRRLPYNTGLGYLEPEFGRNFPSPFFYFIDDSAEQIVYIGVRIRVKVVMRVGVNQITW